MLLIDLTSGIASSDPETVHVEWAKAYVAARALHETTDLSVCIVVKDDYHIEGLALTYEGRILWAVPIGYPESDIQCLLADFCDWIDSLYPAEA